jgi:hypothetical protein
MPSTRTLSRSFVVDRRRLVEARIARECEAWRQEVVVLRSLQGRGRTDAGRSARVS